MAMSLGLVVHVAGGAVGLVSGCVALMTRKGGLRHRQAGAMFVLSMTFMAVSGAYLALERGVFITVFAGVLSLYLLFSSWLTAKRKDGRLFWSDYATMLSGLLVLLLGGWLSWRASNGITDDLGAFIVPAGIYYTFTAITLMAVMLDLTVLMRQGVTGVQRILRHLWRMCVPLYIAASSFFNGQQKVFPEWLHGTIYLDIPENLVLFAMVFWLAKTAFFSNPSRPFWRRSDKSGNVA